MKVALLIAIVIFPQIGYSDELLKKEDIVHDTAFNTANCVTEQRLYLINKGIANYYGYSAKIPYKTGTPCPFPTNTIAALYKKIGERYLKIWDGAGITASINLYRYNEELIFTHDFGDGGMAGTSHQKAYVLGEDQKLEEINEEDFFQWLNTKIKSGQRLAGFSSIDYSASPIVFNSPIFNINDHYRQPSGGSLKVELELVKEGNLYKVVQKRFIDLNKARNLDNLGIIEYKNNNYRKAIELFKQSVDEAPSYYRAWSNLGLAYLREKKYNEAISSGIKVINSSADVSLKASASYNIGKAYEEIGDYKKSLNYYEKSLGFRKNKTREEAVRRLREKLDSTNSSKTLMKVDSNPCHEQKPITIFNEVPFRMTLVTNSSKNDVIKEFGRDGRGYHYIIHTKYKYFSMLGLTNILKKEFPYDYHNVVFAWGKDVNGIFNKIRIGDKDYITIQSLISEIIKNRPIVIKWHDKWINFYLDQECDAYLKHKEEVSAIKSSGINKRFIALLQDDDPWTGIWIWEPYPSAERMYKTNSIYKIDSIDGHYKIIECSAYTPNDQFYGAEVKDNVFSIFANTDTNINRIKEKIELKMRKSKSGYLSIRVSGGRNRIGSGYLIEPTAQQLVSLPLDDCLDSNISSKYDKNKIEENLTVKRTRFQDFYKLPQDEISNHAQDWYDLLTFKIIDKIKLHNTFYLVHYSTGVASSGMCGSSDTNVIALLTYDSSNKRINMQKTITYNECYDGETEIKETDKGDYWDIELSSRSRKGHWKYFKKQPEKIVSIYDKK